jgi:hypothetical protein
MRGEARLRGRERIISSKTIISVYTFPEAGASRETCGQEQRWTMYLSNAVILQSSSNPGI